MKRADIIIRVSFMALLVLSIIFFALNLIPYAITCLLLSFLPMIFEVHCLKKLYRAEKAAHKKSEEAIKNNTIQLAETIQHMKRKSSEDIEQFRSVLSHQLRMPLSIVQGYADILMRDIVTDEDTKKEYLGKIVEHTQTISEILTKQLSAYRNTNKIVPVFMEIDLIDLLERAGDDMQTVARNNGIQIQTLSPVDSFIIEADPYQLNKAIFNIIENSIKYMGREGHITIFTDCRDDDVTITIKDDGFGLDSEETNHIFELNYQGSNKAAGHGHGLYLAKNAAEIHGGSISASSAPGMGMSIKINLPVHQPEDEKEETSEQI